MAQGAEHRIFEYGTGGSTMLLARRCRELVSVENDPDWLLKTQDAVTKAGLTNVHFVMEPDTRTPSAAASAYCRTLDAVYDVIFVDCFCNFSEADLRAPCFARAEQFIAPAGIIVLDDPLMCPVVSTRDSRRLSFRGVKPCQRGSGSTDIYLY
jgi:predicted O-methyltransferase YrrM